MSFHSPSGLTCGSEVRRSCSLGCVSGRCTSSWLDGGAAFPVRFTGKFTNERTWTQAVLLAERKPIAIKPTWEDVISQGGRVLLIETPLHFGGKRPIAGGLQNGGARVALASGGSDGGAPLLLDLATEGTVEVVTTTYDFGPESWGSLDVTFDGGARLVGSFAGLPAGSYDGGL